MGFDREAVKAKLLERKKDLEQELQQLAEARTNGELLQEVRDPVDQATQSELEDFNISLEENQRDEYERIVSALEMLENGIYGKCIDCKRPILEKRLELYPNTTRCITCQERYESQQ